MFKEIIKNNFNNKNNEAGAALAIAIIVVAILSVIALTALAFSSSEARMAGSDLQRTQTFYATASSIEKMTNDFGNVFNKKIRPTAEDLHTIENIYPQPLYEDGFRFQQTLIPDTVKLQEMQTVQGLSGDDYPRVNIPEGPFAGLYATIVPYKITSTGRYPGNLAEVKLEREFNNYLIPLFQFGIFSNNDLEFAPGVKMTFNGRVHSNENIFALQNVKFLNKLTMAGEFIYSSTIDGQTNNLPGKNSVWVEVDGINVKFSKGSTIWGSGTVGGPNLLGSTPGTRGYYPGRPQGIPNPVWETNSILSAVDGVANRFGGQVLTGTTGATQLKMPLQLEGSSLVELIKRSLPTDSEIVSASRYQTKSQVRILIDDLTAGSGASNVAGIPAGKGVILKNDSTGFNPIILDNGGALCRVGDNKSYLDATTIQQQTPTGTQNAMTVRGIKNTLSEIGGNYIPAGSGIEAKILIEVVKPDGTTVDVTKEILSMGMTVGEPNSIVTLQRPIWAAYTQGSRDRNENGFDLVSLTRNTQKVADGEINNPTAYFDATRGFISGPYSILIDEGGDIRSLNPSSDYNQIVPINVYNVREGWFRTQMNEFNIYERGMTSVVEINMHNLARWLDGIYDTNLLNGTNAVSANIKSDDGYIVYISDRRGDKVKDEFLSNGTTYRSTNGTVDNEDIYGPNGVLDEGEDVIDYGWLASGASKKGTLQKDTTELPDLGTVWTPTTPLSIRANQVMQWNNPNNYFRRAVRLFDGETLSFTATDDKLSPTKGITIASENMVYLWGNYNTSGVSSIPNGGSTLNEGDYLGAQVPSSIVCDAIFPLSKTWFDGLSALYPEGASNPRAYSGTPYRLADADVTDISQTTSVRAAIIAGTTKQALNQNPGRDGSNSRRNGGVINFPRFLELWNFGSIITPWNYTGSFNPLYNSTQALGQWESVNSATIYTPPRRNWSFDSTFLNPNKLPPGTPFFQYLQATGFRQSIKN